MTTRTTIPDDVRAAVLADLLILNPSAVAAKHGLKRATVYKIRERNDAIIKPQAAELSTVVELKKQRVAALAMEYLDANLNALTAQAYVAADPNYINRQPAGELAILHGVLADKSIRLLEALHGGAAGDDRA